MTGHAEITGVLNNPLFGGGAMLMVMGGLAAALRNSPKVFFNWLKRRLTVEVQVRNSDEAFEWLTLWLHEHPYSRRNRSLLATTRGSSATYRRDVLFSPAPGNHFFIYKRRPVWLYRERKDKDIAKDGNKPEQETYTIRILGKKQDVIRELIEDARKCVVERERGKVGMYVSSYGYWSKVNSRAMRKIDSVILPDGVSELIISDIRKFIDSRNRYETLGVPYHRGYLFEGLPGTGKSSLVAAIAGELQMDMYALNLASFGLDDQKLQDLLRDVSARSIIVLEDIDAVTINRDAGKEEDKEKGRSSMVSLSGLLNALDGILATEGSVVFMTTNHKNKLDPALIRPGRVDMQVNFTNSVAEQVRRLMLRFKPDADAATVNTFVAGFTGKTMAEAQQHLLLNYL
jgi:mitochondrial chaperone BCS1